MLRMSGLFDGTPLERPVTCLACEKPLDQCACPRGASGEVVLPKDQPARVGREKRRKGKTVTVITGLDPVASNLRAILGQLKLACAAGGTISQDRIEIQGDLVRLVMGCMSFRRRIPADPETQDRTCRQRPSRSTGPSAAGFRLGSGAQANPQMDGQRCCRFRWSNSAGPSPRPTRTHTATGIHVHRPGWLGGGARSQLPSRQVPVAG